VVPTFTPLVPPTSLRYIRLASSCAVAGVGRHLTLHFVSTAPPRLSFLPSFLPTCLLRPMSDYISEQNEREKDCTTRSRETLIAWALGSGAVYGGVTYALHMFCQTLSPPHALRAHLRGAPLTLSLSVCRVSHVPAPPLQTLLSRESTSASKSSPSAVSRLVQYPSSKPRLPPSSHPPSLASVLLQWQPWPRRITAVRWC
jgi:hypothetical protein